MAWVLITQFGPIHPKTQYFVLTSSSNIYTQEIVLSRIQLESNIFINYYGVFLPWDILIKFFWAI